ncbi:MAG: trypsin-like serine protease [Deltaproteobacteria bacterium]|nr:MAG: trypsin-like serine protease [Deltaproteobacteria bacterium]
MRLTRILGVVGLPALLGLLVLSCQVGDNHSVPNTSRQSRPLIGGQKDLKHPAVGALSLDKKSKFCTATLVSPKIVLSAAHCISGVINNLKNKKAAYFRVDTAKTSGTGFTSEYFPFDVAKNHPGYGGTGGAISDDVGYAVLKDPLTKVTPIPLSSASMDLSWIGKRMLFLGYGLIQTSPKRQGTNHKHSLELPIRQVIADRFEVYEKSRSICSGDSGGPALFTVDGKLRIVGVNSYVQGSQSNGNPNCDGSGWCFRVDAYMIWLMSEINSYGYQCVNDSDCGGCYRCTNKACVLQYETPIATLCQPCSTPADCGGNGNLCVRTPTGNRCLQACGKKDCCPKDYACTDVGSGQFQCAPKNLVCPAVTCQRDTDCGPGEVCTNTKCQPKSVPAEPTLCTLCSSDKDCAKGAVCQTFIEGGRCTQPCVADLFCPQGYECKSVSGASNKQCLPIQGFCSCKDNADCGAPFACDKGRCKIPGGGTLGQPCSPSSVHVCAKGFSCFQTSEGNVCLQPCFVGADYPQGTPGSYCRNASVCDSNSSCVLVQGQARICMQRCQSNSDCSEGGTCTNVNNVGVCLCGSDKQCKNGATCNKTLLGGAGVCTKKLALNTTRTCPNNEYCQTFARDLNLCVPRGYREPGQSCSEVKPCLAGLRCTQTTSGQSFCFEQCNTGRCDGGGRCANSTTGRLCVCDETNRCFAGYHCRLTNETGGACVKGSAPSCENDWVCAKGEICQSNACVKDPEYCETNEDCTFTNTCDRNRCVIPEMTNVETAPEGIPEAAGEAQTSDASEAALPDSAKPEQAPEPAVESESVVDRNGGKDGADQETSPPKEETASTTEFQPEQPGTGGQCGCQTTQHHTPLSWMMLVLFGLLGWRRRLG